MGIAVYYLGAKYNVPYTYQILLVAIVLLTWPIFIIINAVRRRRAARAEAATAAAVAEAPAEAQRAVVSSPGKAATVSAPTGTYDELTTKTEEAVQWLRSTRLGGAKKSSEAIYALPWFVVAGPHSSGKTSFVLSSGLSFQALPSQRQAEQNLIRPTADCEWRMTDSAVLLDTAGRYQNEDQNQDEWAALVETIKKQRGNRPLDAFVLAVSAATILRMTETEIEQQAKILRAHLDDVMRRVRKRFPVYLVFTNIDVIKGFEDFFVSSNYTDQSEVWGATIPLEKSANAHALFDVEFDYLYDALMRRRLVRLGEPAQPAQQLRVFNFAPKFSEARSNLGLFTSILFRPNPFSESPLLRGFYFTANLSKQGRASTKQDGNGDNESAIIPVHPVGEGFFTEKLFKEVLLRDKDLAASFQERQKNPHRLRNFILGAAAAIILLFMVGAVVSFFANRKLINEALEHGARVDEITRADVGKNPLQKEPVAARLEVEAVDALRETLENLDAYDRESPPFYLRFGFYSGNEINPYLRTIYFDSVEQRFKKPMIGALERDLQSFAASASTSRPSTNNQQSQSEEEVLGRHYDLLKAYLMLSDQEKVEPTFLAAQLADYWKRSSPADMEIVSQQQLGFYAHQAKREDFPRIKLDEKLVSEVRRKLAAYPAVNRFYKRITTEINAKVNPVSLDSILGTRGRGVLTSTYTVPGSFTLEGYREHMRDRIAAAAEEISKDDWVMGTAASSATTQSTDISKLQSMYLRDYTDQWRKLLRGLSVMPFKSRDDAVTALKVLSGTDSPMERVMVEVARNTNLSAKPEAVGWWAWIKSWFWTTSIDATAGNTEVEKEFQPLFQFVSDADKSTPSVAAQYRKTLADVLTQIESVTDDQLAQTSKSLLTGKDEIGLQKAEQAVGGFLEAFKTASTGEAAALLKQPLGNLRALLYGGGYEQIEKAWRDLYPKARQLESGYPFSDSGEASITDLSNFLNPERGEFTRFFNERLATSFEDVEGKWKLKASGAFKFSDGFVKYINDLRHLRDALFPNGGAQPRVEYEIKLQPVADANVMVEIDGQRVESRGTSSAKFTWPASSGSATGATIKVVPNAPPPVIVSDNANANSNVNANTNTSEEIPPRNFSGQWGLFKMFEAGGGMRGGGGSNEYALSWSVGSVPVRASLRPSSTSNPFQRSLFTGLRAPQNLQK